MIIWINGAFGAGKTQVAGELQRRLPGSVISDPERLGQGIHGMVPPQLRGDFQEDPVWAPGVASVLGRLDDALDAPVIVPMTLADHGRFDTIVGGLRDWGHDVRHASLLGDRETILARLWLRSADARRWAEDRLDDVQAALRDEKFGAHVEVGDLSIPEVANAVATALELDVEPVETNPVRQLLAEIRTALRYP